MHLKLKKKWRGRELGIRRVESVSDILESNGKVETVGLVGGI